MVASLVRVFGVHNLALAEDVVQDALCRALEVWKFHGIPENPSAWLMTAARNRALDVLRRERTARTFAPELGRLLESEWTLVPAVAEIFENPAIQDDLLRMMFSCCHPRLAEEGQVALMLHILCGFGVGEIASAFLASDAAIEKRIVRAKRVLAGSKRLFDLGDRKELAGRLPAVRRAVYLLFNEGYHGACAERAVRIELCEEAVRLTSLLVDHPVSQSPATYALAALLCLHAARLPARIDASGELRSLGEQDRTRWDAKLIAEGQRLLDLSAEGPELSEYHVEAAIALSHSTAPSTRETNWDAVVRLYDTLMNIRPSPVAALSRAIALGERDGPERGLAAIEAIEGKERLSGSPFYAAALGELELRRGRREAAREHFRAARAVARSPMERRYFDRRLHDLPSS